MKTPDYLSYDRYKKDKKKLGSKNNIVTFVVTFFITLLVFTAIAKSLPLMLMSLSVMILRLTRKIQVWGLKNLLTTD
jgi:uncharacterized membrane protein (DUF373 family)